MKPSNFIRVTQILACLLILFVAAAHSQNGLLDPSHRTILRLVIGDSASQEIYSKMGPGIPMPDNSQPGVTQLCFVSDKDETLIVFYSESSRCSRVRLLSPKNWFQKWHFCEKSPLVSKDLAFASGIKLGMSKNRLKKILGPPRSETENTLHYVYEWQPTMAKNEIDAGGRLPPTGQNNHVRAEKAAIRAIFSESGLVSFDVAKYSQY